VRGRRGSVSKRSVGRDAVVLGGDAVVLGTFKRFHRVRQKLVAPLVILLWADVVVLTDSCHRLAREAFEKDNGLWSSRPIRATSRLIPKPGNKIMMRFCIDLDTPQYTDPTV
jgi:hypothetical protein